MIDNTNVMVNRSDIGTSTARSFPGSLYGKIYPVRLSTVPTNSTRSSEQGLTGYDSHGGRSAISYALALLYPHLFTTLQETVQDPLHLFLGLLSTQMQAFGHASGNEGRPHTRRLLEERLDIRLSFKGILVQA